MVSARRRGQREWRPAQDVHGYSEEARMSGAGAPNGVAANGDDGDEGVPEPQVAVHRMITEDWAATFLGLALLLLAMAGVIAKGMVP
jgi:hypothetical protein